MHTILTEALLSLGDWTHTKLLMEKLSWVTSTIDPTAATSFPFAIDIVQTDWWFFLMFNVLWTIRSWIYVRLCCPLVIGTTNKLTGFYLLTISDPTIGTTFSNLNEIFQIYVWFCVFLTCTRQQTIRRWVSVRLSYPWVTGLTPNC